jgi:hypothetical protein
LRGDKNSSLVRIVGQTTRSDNLKILVGCFVMAGDTAGLNDFADRVVPALQAARTLPKGMRGHHAARTPRVAAPEEPFLSSSSVRRTPPRKPVGFRALHSKLLLLQRDIERTSLNP